MTETPWDEGLPTPSSSSTWLKFKPGDTVVLEVLDRETRVSRLRDDKTGEPKQELVATVRVGDAVMQWSPNDNARRELAAHKVANGEVVRVSRLDDENDGVRTRSNWLIERVDGAKKPPPTPDKRHPDPGHDPEIPF